MLATLKSDRPIDQFVNLINFPSNKNFDGGINSGNFRSRVLKTKWSDSFSYERYSRWLPFSKSRLWVWYSTVVLPILLLPLLPQLCIKLFPWGRNFSHCAIFLCKKTKQSCNSSWCGVVSSPTSLIDSQRSVSSCFFSISKTTHVFFLVGYLTTIVFSVLLLIGYLGGLGYSSGFLR